jgi:hypothetical protein
MTQWEIWDQLMAEDEERRVRNARFEAAAAKKRTAAQIVKKPAIPSRPVVLQPLRPGEGKITRTSEGCCMIIYYYPEDIERVARRTPWFLPELLEELHRNSE